MITSIIKLSEIPEDGRPFSWNRQTGEANNVLADLIDKNDFAANFYIHPLNLLDYSLVGSIQTSTIEICSKCGVEFKYALNAKFNEILIPKQQDDRTGKYSKVNHISEKELDGPEVSEYENKAFDMGEYLHEVVALAAPFNAVAPVEADGKHKACNNTNKDQLFIYDEIMPLEDQKNPFDVLKSIKLN